MNTEENSVVKEETVANTCKCRVYGDNDRARLKDFDKLAVTVTDNSGSAPNSTDIEVSGRKCTVCDRIELNPSSFMGVTNLYPNKGVVQSLYAYSQVLSKVNVVDTVNNLRYGAFDLYLSGNSDATEL